MAGTRKPAGRIEGGTMSVTEAVAETISVDNTLPASSGDDNDGDFTELRLVDRANYVIGEEIARGGMGVILDARDRRTGRRLAIKEVRADVMARDPANVRAAVLRFRREAMLTAQLQHPSIVPVHEIGRFGQVPFIAMKRVSGTPLDKLIDGAASSADRLALLPRLRAVADAIAYAHSQGVVHRDIKPANVIVGDFGETIVIDWGLAKVTHESDDDMAELGPTDDLQTMAGAIFGTPQYMAPEQAAGDEVGQPSDVYALGAMLYELLTGEAPYTSVLEPGARAADVIALVCSTPPPAIAELEPDAPRDLISIANKAMARDVADRYASAGELAADIRAYERGQLVEVHDYSAFDLLRRWVSRHRAVVLVALALLVAGAASTAWFVRQTMAARVDAEKQEKRATAELHNAMQLLRDRGLIERRQGNLQRAARSLATAYRHLRDDYALRVALGDIMSSIDPYVRAIHVDPSRVLQLDTDPAHARIAVTVGDMSRVIGLDGRTRFEVDGEAPRFAAAGSYLITQRGTVALIHDGDGALQREIPMPQMIAWDVSTDGELLVVKGYQGVVTGLSLATGEQQFRYFVGGSLPILNRVRVSADGRRAMFLHDSIKLIGTDNQLTELFDLPARGVEMSDMPMALSADGSIAATSIRPGYIDLVRTSDTTQRRSIRAHDRTIIAIEIAPDNRTVVSVDRDGGVCFADISTRKTSCDIDADAVRASIGHGGVVVGHQNGTVSTWDAAGRRLREIAAHADGPATRGFLFPDGALVTAGYDGVVRLWNAPPLPAGAISVAQNGERLEVAGEHVVRRRKTDATMWRIDAPDRPIDIACVKTLTDAMAAGDVIVCGHSLWAPDGTETPIAALKDAVNVAIDERGARLATTNAAGTLTMTAVATRQPSWTVDLLAVEGAGTVPYWPLAFSPDGTRLAVAGPGRTFVLDSASGAIRVVLEHPAEGSIAGNVAFIRDNARIVVGTGKELVLYAADGARLVSIPTRSSLFTPLADHRGVVVASGNRVGVFATDDDDEIDWLGPGGQTTNEVVAVGASAQGLIAVATLGGRVYMLDRRGPLLTTRVADLVRRVDFVGERLIASGHSEVMVWSIAEETRPPDELDAVIDALVGDARIAGQP